MPKYDVMIEYKADRSGVEDTGLDKGLDTVTHRMRHFSAVVVLHGAVLALEAEVEASDPYAAVSCTDARLRMEMKRVDLGAVVGDTTSFWVTDTQRAKAQILLLKDKSA